MSTSFGCAANLSPLSDEFGFDRGTPIDRFYIEAFLRVHSAAIRGRVLEIGDDAYSRRFGGSQITRQDVLHVAPGHPGATIAGDLTDPDLLEPQSIDCIILTQTLHLIFDMGAAVATLHKALRPRGVLLVTAPGITPIDRGDWKDSWYWSLSDNALARLLAGPFKREHVMLNSYGNLFAATAFLHGAAVEDVNRRKLLPFDAAYPVIVAARATA